MEEDTVLGRCLAEEAQPQSAEKLEELRKLKQEAADRPKPPPPPVLTTKFGLSLCRGVSKELVQFVRVFQDLGEKGKKCDALRQEAFIDADPNGNGNCSLAELETYLLKKLLAEFPKEGKGLQMKQPGMDIWTAFRPCCKCWT